MQNEKLFESLQSKIEKRIQYWLKSRNTLYTPIKYIFRAGGKRLRPVITLLSAKAVGGNIQNILDIAVAIEFLHTFTLIHDDIMDHSEKRRGLKTIHKKWDENTAILAGDFLSGLCYKTILSVRNIELLKILEIFTDSYLMVCEGQNEDLEFTQKKFVNMKDYLKMIRKKTAALISASAEIGALAGGGNKAEVKALKDFGLNLGIAFQIKDDILDIIGDPNKLGKPLFQDIYEAKRTYLFNKALEIAGEKEKEFLEKSYSKQPIKKEFVNKIKKLYFELGVIGEAETEVSKYSEIAKKKLHILADTEAKRYLILLTDKITSRNY